MQSRSCEQGGDGRGAGSDAPVRKNQDICAIFNCLCRGLEEILKRLFQRFGSTIYVEEKWQCLCAEARCLAAFDMPDFGKLLVSEDGAAQL